MMPRQATSNGLFKSHKRPDMGEVPVKMAHPTGVSSEDNLKIILMMNLTIVMKSTRREKIQTFMMIFNDFTLN
jgi:hypothetical protein